MVEKTKIHLESEEELMHKLKYEGTQAHKRQHDALLKHLAEFKHEYNRGLCNSKINHFVNDVHLWMITHIRTKDKLYTSFLQENGY